MSDLVPDSPKPETYRGPYGEHPLRISDMITVSFMPDDSDPGDEQPETSAPTDECRGSGSFAIREPRTDNRATPDPAEVAANEVERLRSLLRATQAEAAALKDKCVRHAAETATVRAINEQLRRERVDVEQALGRSIHAGQLGPAVRAELHRWADSEGKREGI